MTAKRKQIVDMIERMPDNDVDVVFEIVNRFAAVEFATPHDERMYEEAKTAIAHGEFVRHEDIDWN